MKPQIYRPLFQDNIELLVRLIYGHTYEQELAEGKVGNLEQALLTARAMEVLYSAFPDPERNDDGSQSKLYYLFTEINDNDFPDLLEGTKLMVDLVGLDLPESQRADLYDLEEDESQPVKLHKDTEASEAGSQSSSQWSGVSYGEDEDETVRLAEDTDPAQRNPNLWYAKIVADIPMT